MKWLPIALLCVALSLHSADADLITIGAAADNTLYNNGTGDISNGSGQNFFTGVNGLGWVMRGLLSFDLANSGIPFGSTITSATLHLNMSQTRSGNTIVDLHQALSPWGEGTSDAPTGEGFGAPAQTGDATWTHSFFNSTLWGTAGGDFAATASASQTIGGNGFYTWSSAQMVADIQFWLDNPPSNFGWELIGDESTGAKRFDSSENGTPENRPSLDIGFVAIPEPSTWLLLVAGFVLFARKRIRG